MPKPLIVRSLKCISGGSGIVVYHGAVHYVTGRGCGGPSALMQPGANSKRRNSLDPEILNYNERMELGDKNICELLAAEICRVLPKAESKIWHAHPVWFLDGNPVVGYSKQKPGIRLMFWSGASFDEEGLNVVGKKFKDASVFFNCDSEVNKTALRRWLKKAKTIQWDYKNIVRRKGKLEKLE